MTGMQNSQRAWATQGGEAGQARVTQDPAGNKTSQAANTLHKVCMRKIPPTATG